MPLTKSTFENVNCGFFLAGNLKVPDPQLGSLTTMILAFKMLNLILTLKEDHAHDRGPIFRRPNDEHIMFTLIQQRRICNSEKHSNPGGTDN